MHLIFFKTENKNIILMLKLIIKKLTKSVNLNLDIVKKSCES